MVSASFRPLLAAGQAVDGHNSGLLELRACELPDPQLVRHLTLLRASALMLSRCSWADAFFPWIWRHFKGVLHCFVMVFVGFCRVSPSFSFENGKVGGPLFLYLILRYLHRRQLLNNSKVLDTYGFLFAGFEPDFYYFAARQSLLMLGCRLKSETYAIL